MNEQEAKHEAEKLMQLFSMNSPSAKFTKSAAMFSVKREIELMEYILNGKCVVHWALEKYMVLIAEKRIILDELKKL